jgi:hypothetical protein
MATNEKDLARTTILMYEIGTGIAAAEVNSICDITQMEFSDDGRFLAIGSQRGSVSVWAVGDHLYRQITGVMHHMSSVADFWQNYPIFLPDYQSHVAVNTEGS